MPDRIDTKAVLERAKKWLEYWDDEDGELPAPEPLWAHLPDGSSEAAESLILHACASALAQEIADSEAAQARIETLEGDAAPFAAQIAQRKTYTVTEDHTAALAPEENP